jgi:2-phospho-L-lactate transferase/gluconeogenesis factor (CofD/UPF0052 family)
MQTIKRRLASLKHLTRPLLLTFAGTVLLSLGAAFLLVWAYQTVPMPGIVYYLTLQFLPGVLRGILLLVLGGTVFAVGVWTLSGVIIISFDQQASGRGEVVVGYRKRRPPRIAVLSGGGGMLVLSSLSNHTERLTCIIPMQDSVEYYYRASNMLHADNVDYVVPTPHNTRVYAELDDSTVINVMHVDHHDHMADRHVRNLFVHPNGDTPAAPSGNSPHATTNMAKLPLTRPARDAICNADAILLGPGSLFESILPNFLMDELREAVQQSKARKIYICNLMTEPGLTSGFSVGEHIRQIKRYADITPDYVLVNVQRIDEEVHQLYASAHQQPVYITPEEFEETMVPAREGITERQLMIENSVVVETDLASSVVQYKASIDKPGESRAARVLRHDPEKLTQAILELLGRE